MITQVWNASFEAIPADNDQISEGALRIRNLKRDIRERAEIDHDWDDVTDGGKHKKVTYVDPISDPPTVVNEGYTYTKNVATKAELHWKDEAGNVLQLTSAGKIPGSALASDALFPTGTKMLFQQTLAPTGWTKDTTHNDKALRVVSGTAGSGGTNAFTSSLGTSFNSAGTVLTQANLPSGVTGQVDNVGAQPAQVIGTGTGVLSVINRTNGGGSGGGGIPNNMGDLVFNLGGTNVPHNHNLAIDLQYVDIIIATKN